MSGELTRIAVEGIPPNTTMLKIQNVFNKYGNIVNIIPSKNLFIIQYSTHDQCQKAINALNGKYFDGARHKLSLKFAEYCKPSSISIYFVDNRDIQQIKTYFKNIKGVDKIDFLHINKEFTGFAYITFKINQNLEKVIHDAKISLRLTVKPYYEITPFRNPDEENLIRLAEEFESRSLIMNDFLIQPDEKAITQLFSVIGTVNYIHTKRQSSFYTVTVLMDKHETARHVMRELNYAYVQDYPIPLHIYPNINIALSRDKYMGLLTINEIDNTFDNAKIFNDFDQYGELYFSEVCPPYNHATSFILVLLYLDYISAEEAKKRIESKNVFLFPAVPAYKAVRFFQPNNSGYSPSIVSFGHKKGEIDYNLRASFSSDNLHNLIEEFYTIPSSNSSKICIATYKAIEGIKNIAQKLRSKSIKFEIINESAATNIFTYAGTMMIPPTWKGRLFYANGIPEYITNMELRLAFGKVAAVLSTIHIHPQKAMILFDENQCINPRSHGFYNLFTSPITMEEVVNGLITSTTPRSLSQGEFQAMLRPPLNTRNRFTSISQDGIVSINDIYRDEFQESLSIIE